MLPSNIWHFTHEEPLAQIITPRHNETYHVGEALSVVASVQDVSEARLTINGQVVETITGFASREIAFRDYTLTGADIGNLVVGVVALNGQGITVNLPPVRIRVMEVDVPEPYVWLVEPSNGDTFNVGDSISVGAFIEGVMHAELRIGEYRQPTTHPFNYHGYNIMFQPYDFTADDIGNVPISVTGFNSDGQFATDSVSVHVSRGAFSRMMENLARDTTLRVPSDERRHSMVVMGQTLLNEGYEPAFVAGMLANIMREGSFGQFESSNYVTNPSAMPQYLRYFVDNHDYGNRFSNRVITDIDASLIEIYNMVLNAPGHGDSDNIFGLGVFQWTNRPRILPLLRNYRAVAGDRGITLAQVEEAEIKQMISELASGQHVGGWGGVPWGADLRSVWRSRNNDIDTVAAAGDAGYIITRLYTRPREQAMRASQRRTDAIDIFHVMTQ